jgi:hypothetical protein
MGLILCFLQSCSTEEVLLEREANIKTVTKEEAIQYLKQNHLKTNGTKAEKTTAYLNYGAITQEKITNSNQFLTVIPLLNSNKTQSSRVLLLRVNDTLKSAVFTMSPEGKVKTKEFSGRIMIIGIDGEFINGFRVKDGFLISQFIQKTPSKQSTRIANKATADYTTEPIQLDEVIIPPRKKAAIEINYLFDWYSAYDNSNSDSYLWDFVENSGSGGGSTEPVVEEENFEDKIDDSKLDPCPKGIMEKLKNTENKDIASVINKLEANSIYTVDMKMGSTAQGYAQTQKVSTNNYLITVANDSYTSSTQLFRAASLIHEIIHAYYHSVVDDNKNPTTTPLNNFPALYQAYELKKYPGGATVAQHDQMAKDYVDAMALALQEYYINNKPLLFPLASYEVFTDLAWGTL